MLPSSRNRCLPVQWNGRRPDVGWMDLNKQLLFGFKLDSCSLESAVLNLTAGDKHLATAMAEWEAARPGPDQTHPSSYAIDLQRRRRMWIIDPPLLGVVIFNMNLCPATLVLPWMELTACSIIPALRAWS